MASTPSSTSRDAVAHPALAQRVDRQVGVVGAVLHKQDLDRDSVIPVGHGSLRLVRSREGLRSHRHRILRLHGHVGQADRERSRAVRNRRPAAGAAFRRRGGPSPTGRPTARRRRAGIARSRAACFVAAQGGNRRGLSSGSEHGPSVGRRRRSGTQASGEDGGGAVDSISGGERRSLQTQRTPSARSRALRNFRMVFSLDRGQGRRSNVIGRLTGSRRVAGQAQNMLKERSREMRNRFMTCLVLLRRRPVGKAPSPSPSPVLGDAGP